MLNNQIRIMKKLYFLLFGLLISLTSFAQVINEIDSDTPGTDVAEFVELKWTPNTALDGYVIVFYNGSNDTSYAAYDLDGKTTDANGFFILANVSLATGSDIVFPDNGLQNGADAVALYMASDTDFPNGTAVTSINLVDALVYGTADADDAELLAGLGESVQYDESANANSANESIQRKIDGTYETKAPTFRAENDAAVCELVLSNASATCDAVTVNVDTYTATIDFSGGGTGTYIVDTESYSHSGGDPNVDTSGTITITGIPEGTDVTVTVTSSLCDLTTTITSPNCDPFLPLPLYEPFAYTNGNALINESADWANISSSVDEVMVNMGNLSYSGLPASTGNMVLFGGAGSDPALSFSPVTSGDIYTSFIFSVSDQSLMTDLTDGGYFAILNSGGSNFDLRLWVRPNPDASGSTFDIGFGDATSSPPVSSSTYTVGESIFIVMSYNIDNGNYNLWINPNSADFGGSAPVATMTGTDASPASSIGQFVIRQDSTGETPDMFMDELRIGTTWADVTPNNLSVGEFLPNSVKIFPNPTSTGVVNIVSTNSSPMEVRVFDILGKQVRTETITSTLNVSGLKSGIYILNITQEGHSVTKKLVIE